MTVIERINQALKEADLETDSINKIIALAYYIGREDACKEVSDDYNALIAEQRVRANNNRYHKFANAVIGDQDYIYHSDYKQDIKTLFGDEQTNI